MFEKKQKMALLCLTKIFISINILRTSHKKVFAMLKAAISRRPTVYESAYAYITYVCKNSYVFILCKNMRYKPVCLETL